MKDTKLLIENYEKLREVCIDLCDIAERHPDLKQVHDSLMQIGDILMDKAHEIFTDAHKLKEEENNEEI